ncbi:DsrE/DsrF/DrsH-like family protein [Methanogenium organophilum]|uniref:DsrE/DsrF/DrsH-like family protein n=1 Tax=Methanogenium organophilum TaxID=2199 RepID=A0A9X9T7T3_METOG|nr:DsrE/DsrF/DrsH-like family protein [Methanogenium organophilum]WAI01419.1 DsrE/DsrF/DrsH-like family protein [Methanogenium organophilum]
MTKLSLIVTSEKIDKLFPATTLATTAAISGWEADIFFTFWGLLALKKGYEPSQVSLDYQEYGDKLSGAIASGAMPGWRELLEKGKATGRVKVYACSATMALFGMTEDELETFVDGVAGAATYLGLARDADVSLFIS